MVTDDERRGAARRLRELDREENYTLSDFIWAIIATCNKHISVPAYLADLIEPQPVTGETSDGYHTFDELYDHRAKLFSVIVRDHREIAWKSMFHHDGTMYEGMFIVGVETPQGQATYHYDIDPYWDIFDCKELVRAPEWDGHTPEQAISRIASLWPTCDRDALLELVDEMETADPEDLDVAIDYVTECASRIREALGAES